MKDFDQAYSNLLHQASLRALEEDWTKINLVELETTNLKHYEAWRFYDDRADMILEWCDSHCGEYSEFAGKFYFKDPHDATLFSMRWVGQNK